MRTALVNAKKIVTDVIVAGDGYEPPEGFAAVASDTAGIGDAYDAKAGSFIRPGLDDQSLDDLKDTLRRHVDVAAERLRQAVLTPGVGQAMEYQEAQAQAATALDASAGGGTVKDSDYPMLAATVGVDIDPATKKPATDVLGVARSVLAAKAAWEAFGAAIREARIKGKAAIAAAKTAGAAEAAFEAIAWPAMG